jgi:hypothetical protein
LSFLRRSSRPSFFDTTAFEAAGFLKNLASASGISTLAEIDLGSAGAFVTFFFAFFGAGFAGFFGATFFFFVAISVSSSTSRCGAPAAFACADEAKGPEAGKHSGRI